MIIIILIYLELVGGFKPSENMKLSWDDYSQYMESHKSHVPNHQPVIYYDIFILIMNLIIVMMTMTPTPLGRKLSSSNFAKAQAVLANLGDGNCQGRESHEMDNHYNYNL
jgi:hypothetical protein